LNGRAVTGLGVYGGNLGGGIGRKRSGNETREVPQPGTRPGSAEGRGGAARAGSEKPEETGGARRKGEEGERGRVPQKRGAGGPGGLHEKCGQIEETAEAGPAKGCTRAGSDRRKRKEDAQPTSLEDAPKPKADAEVNAAKERVAEVCRGHNERNRNPYGNKLCPAEKSPPRVPSGTRHPFPPGYPEQEKVSPN